MTQQEHALMIGMFAQQMHISLALFEILKSNDFAKDEDFDAYYYAASPVPENVVKVIAKQYVDAAVSLGLKVESPPQSRE